jgi:hypothetical protein
MLWRREKSCTAGNRTWTVQSVAISTLPHSVRICGWSVGDWVGWLVCQASNPNWLTYLLTRSPFGHDLGKLRYLSEDLSTHVFMYMRVDAVPESVLQRLLENM